MTVTGNRGRDATEAERKTFYPRQVRESILEATRCLSSRWAGTQVRDVLIVYINARRGRPVIGSGEPSSSMIKLATQRYFGLRFRKSESPTVEHLMQTRPLLGTLECKAGMPGHRWVVQLASGRGAVAARGHA